MHFKKDQLTIGYADFIQFYRDDRVLTYTIDDSKVHVPITNLIKRKAHLAETVAQELGIQADWDRAAQLRENMFLSQLADEDFMYMHVCVDPQLSANFKPTSVTIKGEDGLPQSVYVLFEANAFKQQVFTPRVTSGQPVVQRQLHA